MPALAAGLASLAGPAASAAAAQPRRLSKRALDPDVFFPCAEIYVKWSLLGFEGNLYWTNVLILSNGSVPRLLKVKRAQWFPWLPVQEMGSLGMMITSICRNELASYFPCLVLKGILHYWKSVIIFSRGLKQMKVCGAPLIFPDLWGASSRLRGPRQGARESLVPPADCLVSCMKF